jgi:SAM-dependent methyltransferase
MFDPATAVAQWWSLVKPGGYLVLVVPHEDLYEQGLWPSKFNPDHKFTFRLDKAESWSPVSFDIRELVRGLPHCEIIAAEVHDENYDYSLLMKPGAVYRKKLFGLRFLKSIAKRIPVVGPRLRKHVERFGVRHGVPVDQTAGAALAQIQIVARKAA